VSGGAFLAADRVGFEYRSHGRCVGPFSLAADPGEVHLVCGPSGCGKSTLARMLSGVIPHLYRGRFEGRVRIGGRCTRDTPLWQISASVGLVSQNPTSQLLASTVVGEVVFGLENLGLASAEIGTRLDEALWRFELHPFAERDPRTLSGGEQQRLLLAAVTARRPRALVMDEPLSMLDAFSTQAAVADIERLRDGGCAVVAFEHCRESLARLGGVKRLDLAPADVTDPPLPDLNRKAPAFRLVVEGLSVELGGRAVLRGIDLSLGGGEVLALAGANGAGKTTLLRALCGLQPHRGRITGYASGAGAPRLGMSFQNPDRQIFNPTVRDEILYGHAEPDEDLYRDVVDMLGLAAYEGTPPLLLSEGEKKRLGLAILLLRPGLCGLCLDEPTLGQDQHGRRLLGRVVRKLAAAGYLCLIATHDLEWAAQWCDRVLLLQNGGIASSRDSLSCQERSGEVVR